MSYTVGHGPGRARSVSTGQRTLWRYGKSDHPVAASPCRRLWPGRGGYGSLPVRRARPFAAGVGSCRRRRSAGLAWGSQLSGAGPDRRHGIAQKRRHMIAETGDTLALAWRRALFGWLASATTLTCLGGIPAPHTLPLGLALGGVRTARPLPLGLALGGVRAARPLGRGPLLRRRRLLAAPAASAARACAFARGGIEHSRFPAYVVSGIAQLTSAAMASTASASSGVTSVIARPSRPARPVRPMRWT